MKKNDTIYLDDETYLVSQYSASKGIRLLTKLTKLLGKPLAMLTSGGGLDSQITPDLISNCFDSLSENLNENEIEKLIKEVLDGTLKIEKETNTNRPINFDLDFAGRYGHLFKLLSQVVQFQYNDFLGEIIGRAQKVQPVTKKKMKAM